MLDRKIDFQRICTNVKEWKWNELKIGLKKSLISEKDIIFYANQILSEGMENFEIIINLSIAEEGEVEDILNYLVSKEEKTDLKSVNDKWMFAIILDAYIYAHDEIYCVIDEVYTEFDYPDELSNLIGYMPSNDTRTLKQKLEEYIEKGKESWCKKH